MALVLRIDRGKESMAALDLNGAMAKTLVAVQLLLLQLLVYDSFASDSLILINLAYDLYV